MTRLNKEEVKAFIEKRYPEEKVIAVEMFDTRDDMAFVLTMYNTSAVSRYVVDINSDGEMDLWSHECARFEQIWRRSEV